MRVVLGSPSSPASSLAMRAHACARSSVRASSFRGLIQIRVVMNGWYSLPLLLDIRSAVFFNIIEESHCVLKSRN